MRKRRTFIFLLLGLAALAMAWGPAVVHTRAAGVLLAVMGDPPAAAQQLMYEVQVHDAQLALDERQLRARRYTPRGVDRPAGLVLIHGVHYKGIDEPRLRAFARAMASAGVQVLTPEIPELAAYRIEPSTIDAIEASARWLARESGRRRAGVMGISFGGGLSLLAAARAEGRTPIGFVVALGAHHDLRRLARYYAGKPIRDPDGKAYPARPHPYGARVILHRHIDKLFADGDVPEAKRALALYLRDQHRAARQVARDMSPAGSQKLLRLLDPDNDRAVGRALLTAVDEWGHALDVVSPRDQLAELRVPVYLVHGAGDPVVPSTETAWLAREVPDEVLRAAIISPVIRHAEVDQEPSAWEYWTLIHFMAEVLAEARRLP